MSEIVAASPDVDAETPPWFVVPQGLDSALALEWAQAVAREVEEDGDDVTELIADLAEWASPEFERSDRLRLAFVLGPTLGPLRVWLVADRPDDQSMKLTAEEDNGDNYLEYFTMNGHAGRVLTRRINVDVEELATEHMHVSSVVGQLIVGVNRTLPCGAELELQGITEHENALLLATGMECLKMLLSGDDVMEFIDSPVE